MDPVTPTIFKITLTGGATYDKLPLPKGVVRKVLFKSRGSLTLKYRYSPTGESVEMLAADIYDLNNVTWKDPYIEVNGNAADIVDGEYWM